MNEQRFNPLTPNFRTEAAKKIASLFPEVVADGEIDFDALQEALSPDLEDEESNEKYEFIWRGKQNAKKIADAPSEDITLIGNKEKSENWNKTKNVYIEGDNLEVLKLLQKSYSDKVQMIYIDPPYNTGNEFIYKDDFSDSYKSYLEQTNQIDSNGNATTTQKEARGRIHTAWLNMMYPRLKLARRLLKESGVIFISIDDHEQANLVKIMNEIFGERNYLGMLVWKSRVKPSNQGEAAVRPQGDVEYVLVYGKDINETQFYGLKSDKERKYPYSLNGRKYRLATILKSNRGINSRKTMNFEFHGYKPSDTQRWQAGKEKIQELWDRNQIEFKNGTPFRRYFKDEENEISQPFYNFMLPSVTGTAESGKKRLNDLLGNKHGFDTVKPVPLIQRLIAATTKDSDLIMDFFAGSSTTAEAVLQQNLKDNFNRKYILVQLNDKQESVNSSFSSVTELGEERIKKVNGELKKKNEQQLDYGFRVYELQKSTINHWDENPENFEKQINLLNNAFTEKSTDDERAREIALKSGITLDESPIIDGSNYHYLTDDKEVFVILGNYDETLLDELNKERKMQYALVVLKEMDSGSETKFNLIEHLKQSANLMNHFNLEWI